MIRFEISVEGAVGVISYVQSKLSDLREFYEEYFYPKMLRDFDKLFEEEGRPHWAALSDKWAYYKSRVVPHAKILEFSGDLRDSYTISSHPNHELEITARTISLRSTIEYASLHETGTDVMSARPVVGSLSLDKGLRNQYNKLLRRHVQRIVRESGESAKVGVSTEVSKQQSKFKARRRKRVATIRI